MNKIGIYYAYWTHDWDADFHPFIDKVAELGFDVLEVNAGTIACMTPEARQSLKAHADDRNIILSHCIGLPHEYDIASEDEAIRANGIATLRESLRQLVKWAGEIYLGLSMVPGPPPCPKARRINAPMSSAALPV